MRTTSSFLLAALASVAIAHSTKPDYMDQHGGDADHDGSGLGEMAGHGAGHNSDKGIWSSLKSGKWPSHAQPTGAPHHGHGGWAHDDDSEDSEMQRRDALFGWGKKNKNHDQVGPNQGPDYEEPSNFLPNNMHDVKPFPNEEYYDEEGRVIDQIPDPSDPKHRHHARSEHHSPGYMKHNFHVEDEEFYDDEGRLIGAHDEEFEVPRHRLERLHQARSAPHTAPDGYDDDEDDEDDAEIDLPTDEGSRQMRANWYAAEQANGYPGNEPPGWTQHDYNRPIGNDHHARSTDDDDEDDEDGMNHIKLATDETSRKHPNDWYAEEQHNGFKGQSQQGYPQGQAAAAHHEDKPAYHRHYSAHQMRGVNVDREAATNSDQYYYDVGDEGDEGEYDPTYAGEDYEGFEKRMA